MDLGDAKITIKVDDNATNKLAQIGNSADKMAAKFRTVGKVMVGVGLAIAGALTAAVVTYAKVGDEVHKMALRTGFATETLSELRHVADLSGASLTTIEKATKKMSKTIIDADRGLETYVKTFEELGINIAELRSMKPEEQFWTIANAIADVEDQTLKAALAQEVFGRAGTDLLPMLASGTEAITEMRQEAHELGVVFDQVAANKAAALTDAMSKLKMSIQGVSNALAEELVPTITEFLEDKVIPAITRIMDWVKGNEDLAKTLGIVAGVLVGGGALLLGLGAVSKAIIAINAARILMLSLMGPAGWTQLAAGIAIAAGAIYATKKLVESPETPKPSKVFEYALPSAQYGGVVPGIIGAPVPIMAHGGEEFAGVGNSIGGTININVGNFMGDDASLRSFARTIKDVLGKEGRRTSFSGINKLGYFPGSSAP